MKTQAILMCLALVGCHKSGPKLAATSSSQPIPVNITDSPNYGGNVLGVQANPLFVSSTGSADGGATTVVSVNNDAGNSLPVDTTPGDLNSTVVHFSAATGAGVITTAAAWTFVGANVCNEGTLTAWFQIFAGETIPDASGTNAAATVPTIIPLRIPAGACASLTEPQALADGGVWYSSSTQGLLTVDAGVQSMSVDITRR